MGEYTDRGDYQYDFYYSYFVKTNGKWSSPYYGSTQYECEEREGLLYDEEKSGYIDAWRAVYTSFDRTELLQVWEKCVCKLANHTGNIDYAIETLMW